MPIEKRFYRPAEHDVKPSTSIFVACPHCGVQRPYSMVGPALELVTCRAFETWKVSLEGCGEHYVIERIAAIVVRKETEVSTLIFNTEAGGA